MRLNSAIGILCFVLIAQAIPSVFAATLQETETELDTIGPTTVTFPWVEYIPDSSLNAQTSFSKALTPVARFDTVPFQRIDAGQFFNVSVVAFSKNGIRDVTFEIKKDLATNFLSNACKNRVQDESTGVQAKENSFVVNQMTPNPATGVWEYWVSIPSDCFGSDGVYSIEATVHGLDGGVRTKDTGNEDEGLEPLIVKVNANNSDPQVKAWVQLNANGTGEINNPNKPFSSIHQAIEATRSANNNRGDGVVIYLHEGEYTNAGGNTEDTICDSEWLTITSSPDADPSKVRIRFAFYGVSKLKWENVTFEDPDGWQTGLVNGRLRNGTGDVWVSQARLLGKDRFARGGGYSLISDAVHRVFLTDTNIFDVAMVSLAGSKTPLARNLRIERISNDAFQENPMVVNVFLNDLDCRSANCPGGWHADGYQGGNYGQNNTIVYNFVGKNLHYQTLFWANWHLSSNNAFVNIFMDMAEGTGGGGFSGKFDHLILWHNTFLKNGSEDDPPFTISVEDCRGSQACAQENSCTQRECHILEIENASIRNNVFWAFGTNALEDGIFEQENNDVYDNHYVTTTGFASGWPVSVIDKAESGSFGPLKVILNRSDPDFGRPQDTSSPLVNRSHQPESLVPADASGRPRNSVHPTLGALEFGNPVSSGTSCDDQDWCTVNDRYASNGVCIGTLRQCVDQNSAAIGSCDSQKKSCTSPELSGTLVPQGVSSMLFTDDFEEGNLNNWRLTNGIWTIVPEGNSRMLDLSGVLESDNWPPQEKLFAIALAKDIVASDFEYSARIRSTDSSEYRDLALVFGYQNENNYNLVIFNGMDDDRTNGIFAVENGVRRKLHSLRGKATLDVNQWHTVKVQKAGSSATVIVDGFNVFTTGSLPFTFGGFGIGSINDNGQFDQIQITKFDSNSAKLDNNLLILEKIASWSQQLNRTEFTKDATPFLDLIWKQLFEKPDSSGTAN